MRNYSEEKTEELRAKTLLAALEDAVSLHAARRKRQATRSDALQRIAQLTPRESKVFQRVTEGNHNREIAEELGISLRTVEAHRARLMDTLAAPRGSTSSGCGSLPTVRTGSRSDQAGSSVNRTSRTISS
jgi:DNA-binding NarL/FixJ family response regulator